MNKELSNKILRALFKLLKFLPRCSLKLISFFENKVSTNYKKDTVFEYNKKDIIPMRSWYLSINSYFESEKFGRPLISIVMPIYNSDKSYLEKSIRSCLNQTYNNIELIIVEDGSNQGSEDLVKSFLDNRIIYIKKEKNEKLPAALNTGFKQSKGQYLSWTSDDNIYMEEAIETMYNFLIKNPVYDFVYSDWYCIDEDDNLIDIKLNRLPSYLNEHNPIGPCFLYKRSVYETVGEYSSEYVGVEDYEYWIRTSRLFNMYALRKVLYFYRFHSKSLTTKKHKSILSTQKIMLEEYF